MGNSFVASLIFKDEVCEFMLEDTTFGLSEFHLLAESEWNYIYQTRCYSNLDTCHALMNVGELMWTGLIIISNTLVCEREWGLSITS